MQPALSKWWYRINKWTWQRTCPACGCLSVLFPARKQSLILRRDMTSRRKSIAEVIPHFLQVQVQEKLANQGRYNSWDCAKCVCVDRCFSTIRAEDVPILVCLRSSCNCGTDVGVPYYLWDYSDGCETKWRRLFGCNSPINSYTLMYLVSKGFYLQAAEKLQDTSTNLKQKDGTREYI